MRAVSSLMRSATISIQCAARCNVCWAALSSPQPVSTVAQFNRSNDLSDLPSGTYHLWIRANDGINGPASSYASAPALLAAKATPSRYGLNAVWLAKDDYNLATELAAAIPIVIDSATTFPAQWTATITPTVDSAANALDVTWRVNSHPDIDSYRLLVGNSPLNPTLVITAGTVALLDANDNLTGVEVGFARLANVRPDVDYFLALEAIDAENGRYVLATFGDYSGVVLH